MNDDLIPRPPDSDPLAFATSYELAAAHFLEILKYAASLVPFFLPKHPDNMRVVVQYHSFSDFVIGDAIAAVEDSPELSGIGKYNLKKARACVEFMNAFKGPIDAAMALATDMKFTYDHLRAETIRDSLQMYAIAKGVARDPASWAVAGHVRAMKRDLKTKRRKRKSDPPAADSSTAPAAE